MREFQLLGKEGILDAFSGVETHVWYEMPENP